MSRRVAGVAIAALAIALGAGVAATVSAESGLEAVTWSYGGGFGVLAILGLVAILTFDGTAILTTLGAAALLVLHCCWFWAVAGLLFSTNETQKLCPPLSGGFDHLESQFFPPWIACVGGDGDRAIVTSPVTTVLATLFPLALAAAAIGLLAWVIARTRHPAVTITSD